MSEPRDGNARHQCVCGHERHEGLCGKPRYASTDLCKCNVFIEALESLDVRNMRLMAEADRS